MVKQYSCLVFDCDGVILNSNKLKTQAFYKAALSYGETPAQALVNYHVQNGGISRYRKFEYFLQTILNVAIEPTALNTLVSAYAAYVKEGLLTCDIAPGLQELRQAFPEPRWLVVSGSDQAELREVFTKRNISHFFDGGIFGSPDTKDEILVREVENGNIQKPAVFLGDSRYDYEAANRGGLDFIFVSRWSEWSNYSETIFDVQIQMIKDLVNI